MREKTLIQDICYESAEGCDIFVLVLKRKVHVCFDCFFLNSRCCKKVKLLQKKQKA